MLWGDRKFGFSRRYHRIDQINQDVKFLDEIKKVFDEYETSAQFTTARNQLGKAYRLARNSFKKTHKKRK